MVALIVLLTALLLEMPASTASSAAADGVALPVPVAAHTAAGH
jgi:hypothetical protein